MALLRDGRAVPDPFTDSSAGDTLPAAGPVLVSLAQWQVRRDELLARGTPLGIRLRSDQSPTQIAGDLGYFAVVALEFPKYRDGRAYTHARILKERLGYIGEIRAVGDVLQEQLHFMQRCGFNAFEIPGADPELAWRTIAGDHTVWYQATGDGRPRALDRRHRRYALQAVNHNWARTTSEEVQRLAGGAYTRRMSSPDTSPLALASGTREDDSLIGWMRSLSPAERLQVLQGFVDSVSELRRDQSTPVPGRP